MKRERDPRINVGNISIRGYFILFLSLAAFNGFHMTIFRFFEINGMLQANVQFVINIFIVYVLVVTAIITGSIAVVSRISWSRPMQKLSEAARRITRGDFSVRISPLRKDGKKDYIEVTFDDFNTMAQELQSIETLKNDFIANVSHEIKTPLAVIQNYAAVLQSDSLNTDIRHDYLKTIVEASQKLSMLVSNILKLNKLENQEILPKANPFDLSEQIRRCVVAVEDQWERKQISFELELEESTVSYDEDMLEIVWNNLISNAIKFTNLGGTVFIKLKVHDCYVRVTVSDTGCGMDSETQRHIFDKFYQGDSSHAQEGNGLGLALVKRTIDLFDGTVTVESLPGQGAAFTVCLKI
ncbi:MAG: HAMP domain-containing histidine kinase [Treponema sp.]|nr:HAMP domain-containing histidine kinase [Treponema sp.]